MALRKKIETPSGHTNEYHKVAYTEVSYVDRTCRIGLLSYANKAARDDDKQPFAAPMYAMVQGDDFDLKDGEDVTRAWAYSKIAKLPEFKSATKV